VRAQSQHSPHRVGGTTVTPDKSINSLSLRAYQSGHVIYRTNITSTDTSIAHYRVEGPIRSAIAFPIGGENGPVIGVLYAVSDEPDAFSEQSQRVLRMICRMAEEAICTYRTRRQTATRLTNAIDRPRSVDALFEEFLSENDFIRDFEKLLTELKAQLPVWKEPILKEKAPLEERKTQARAEQHSGNVVSFIAIDIDNQSSLATKYGDQVARNLSKEVGLRIQGQIRLFADPEHRRLYRVYADRFYLMLKGMTLDEARAKAEQLRQDLQGSYRVNARNIPAEHLRLPERMLELSDITVRLGVSSYSYEKLKELLQRYSFETAREDIRVEIMRALDILLNYGQQKEGNVIFSWDIDTWDYKPWAPNT
jgi:GGDEF domain-containing protein